MSLGWGDSLLLSSLSAFLWFFLFGLGLDFSLEFLLHLSESQQCCFGLSGLGGSAFFNDSRLKRVKNPKVYVRDQAPPAWDFPQLLQPQIPTAILLMLVYLFQSASFMMKIRWSTIRSYLSAEITIVSGVLRELELLDDFSQSGTISGPVFSGDSDFDSSLGHFLSNNSVL